MRPVSVSSLTYEGKIDFDSVLQMCQTNNEQNLREKFVSYVFFPELSKQCSEDNGGCSHFCVMKGNLPVCKCAHGYTLAEDKRTCESTGRRDVRLFMARIMLIYTT